MRRLLALLLLPGCAHLAAVESGVRARELAGRWRSVRGDRFLIGCSGAFNTDLHDELTDTHETGAHLSAVTATGFTVSHWPLKDDHYDVAAWPHKDAQGRVVMTAEGMEWFKTAPIACE